MITIVIPAYNAEKYLPHTLESVMTQDYDDYEIILVDDGSTDKTLEIMQEYQLRKKNVPITVITGPHFGVATARNKGMFEAKGQYILFFDADDIMPSNYLDRLAECMYNTESDLIISNAIKINEDGDILKSLPINSHLKEGFYSLNKKNDLIELGENIEAIPGTKLYKSSIIINNHLEFDDIEIYSDMAFCLKYIIHCNYVYVLNTAVMQYRIVNNSLSHSISNKDLSVIDSFRIVEKYVKSLIIFNDDFNFLLQNMKIKKYNIWSLRYTLPTAYSRSLRRRLFKAFHKEMIKDGKKEMFYLSPESQHDVKSAFRRYIFKFFYLTKIYIAFHRIVESTKYQKKGEKIYVL